MSRCRKWLMGRRAGADLPSLKLRRAGKWFAVTAASVEAAKAEREADKEAKNVKLPGVKAA